jgi:hypothetical protein
MALAKRSAIPTADDTTTSLVRINAIVNVAIEPKIR